MTSSSHPPQFPPDLSVPLHRLVDFHREHNSDLPYALWYSDTSKAIERVSWLEFSHAVDRVAHTLRPNRAGPEGEVVALIANCDTLLYVAIHLGMMKAGFVPFPISARNSPLAVANLLKKTNCHRIITTNFTLEALIQSTSALLFVEGHEVLVTELPTLHEIFPYLGYENDDHPSVPYPDADHFDPKSVAYYLHSSGTTSLPKPIPQTHERVTDWCRLPVIEQVSRNWTNYARPYGAMASLPFHTLGILSLFMTPLVGCVPVALFEPTYPAPSPVPTPVTILHAARETDAAIIFLVPSFLEAFATQSEAVDYLVTTDQVWFGGGPLSDEVGEFLISKGVKIHTFWGATEVGSTSLPWNDKRKEPHEYAFFEFSDRCDIRWDDKGDGRYEQVYLSTSSHKPSVVNLPEVNGYSTGDLWEPHPTKPDLWKIVGRTDDVIVLSTGEKVLPGGTESALLSHPKVSGVAMFGRQRAQVGILVELRPQYSVDPQNTIAVKAMQQEIWPTVEAANEEAPDFGRVFKEMIIFASYTKPMLRTAKGTTVRQASLDLYHTEVDKLYEAIESGATGEEVEGPATWTSHELEGWLELQISIVKDGKIFDRSSDLFAQGFDSLSVTSLTMRIKKAFRAAGQDATKSISSVWVYEHPTILDLASALAILASPSVTTSTHKKAQALSEMIDKYTSLLEEFTNQDVRSPSEGQGDTIFITGTTGGLGAQLLASCVANPRVRRIYAYNRKASKGTSEERHMSAYIDRGLMVDPSQATQKVVFLEGDLSQPYLDLSPQAYTQIQTSVNIIIHSAWVLNFNLSLASFESQVRGTTNLANMALTSPISSRVRLLFMSSIGVSGNWDPTKPYPEEVLTTDEAGWTVDDANWHGTGYGEGKFVTEAMLAKANDKGLQTTSFRIGQISGGDPIGAWSTTDWVPILAKSSKALGLPILPGLVSWIPMDVVADGVLDVAFASEKPVPALNFVHPKPIAWETVMTYLAEAIEDAGHGRVSLVPFANWLQELERRAEGAQEVDLQKIPALKLDNFFRAFAAGIDLPEDAEAGGAATLAVERSCAASEAMRGAQPIGKQSVATWVKYWDSKGYFDDA